MAKTDTSNAKNGPLGSNTDALNPGDQHYREELIGGNKEYDDAHGDRVQRNYNADKDNDSDSRQDLDNQERSGDSLYKQGPKKQAKNPGSKGSRSKGFLKGKLRGKGPLGGIVALLLVLGGTGASFLGPASLLTNFSSILSNHMDFGNRLLGKTGKSYATAIFGGRNCAESKIKCKFASVSDKRVKEWEKRGIKVIKDDKPNVFGRYKIRGLVFPDGKEVTTKRAYNNLKFSDPYNFSKLQRFPIRATYLDAKSSINKSLGKFGRSLSTKFKSSTKKDKNERVAENRSSMDRLTDSSPDRESRISKIKSTGKSKVSSATSQISNKMKSVETAVKGANFAIAGANLACTANNLVKATQASILLLWHAELIKFMLPFIQAGSQAKEAGVNGEFDWETAEYFGDRLTHAVTQKEIDADPDDEITQDMLGKTAMDSAGFAAALNGDFGNYNDNYTGWSPATAIWGGGVRQRVEDLLGGKENISKTCNTARALGWAALAACVGPQGLGCAAWGIAQFLVFNVWGDDIVGLVTEQLADDALEQIADANLSSELTGPALGDAIVSGAGVLASYSDRASGFAVAGNNEQAFTAYRDILHDVDFQESKLADSMDSARKNQFDINNRFSFAGRVASAVSRVPWNGTLLSGIANASHIASSLPSSTVASAMKQGIYQPIDVLSSEEKFRGAISGCKNTGLTDLEIPCIGESGRAVPVIGGSVEACLDAEANQDTGTSCIDRAIDYLSIKKYKDSEGNQISYINGDTGEPGGWSEYQSAKEYDNPFLMFMRYCGNDREYPLGYMDMPYEDSTDWHDGMACAYSGNKAQDDDLAWMSYYYTMCIAHYASDNDQDYCWGVETAAAVTNTGSWVVPTSGPCLSSFGFRWGTIHRGIDISPPSGTAIVAPTSMEIIFAGPKPDGYGVSVVAKATDGTNFSFRFGHMLDQPPVSAGQKVSKGQTIGRVGSTGDSTGPHLHLEIFPSGVDPMTYAGAVDPVPVLAKNGVSITCQGNTP